MTSTLTRPTPMGSEAENVPFLEKANNNNNNAFNEKDIQNLSISNNTTSVPPYEKWKSSIASLLSDSEGLQIFYEYLKTDQLAVLFDCWYSCDKYRSQLPNKAAAKEVYSRYVRIKDSRVPISDQARNNLALRLRANDVTENLLLEIEHEVYSNLRDVQYPKFLKSDFFTFYCETSGQVQYEATDFHRSMQPVHHHVLSPLAEGQLTDFHTQALGNGLQQSSSLTPYEASQQQKLQERKGNISTDAFADSDKMSTTDSRISCGSGGRSKHGATQDGQLYDIPNFKPLTMRRESMKQLPPDQFAKVLCEKLEQVIAERKGLKQAKRQQDVPSQLPPSHRQPEYYQPAPSMHTVSAYSDVDSQSMMPPASDRYSVAGASSHSGSGVHSEQPKQYQKFAKNFLNAVHHGIRNNLGECQCATCVQTMYRGGNHHEQYVNAQHYHELAHAVPHGYNPNYHRDPYDPYEQHHQQAAYAQQQQHQQMEPAQPIDRSKIYAWFEKNERIQASPSPAVRRKKHQNVPEAPIAQDHNMPLLPQPDTGTVLTEVKRVLEQPKPSRQPSSSTRRTSRQHHGHGYSDQMSAYSDPTYPAGMGGGGGGWNTQMSDTTSIVSYQPSQISSVPSSASRMWNQYGYYEPQYLTQQQRAGGGGNHSDVTPTSQHHHRSERHSDVTHNRDRQSRTDRHSDVTPSHEGRSEAGSNSSAKKDQTTITYYFGIERIPYRITIKSPEVTLAQFKAETKRGNFRYFFKTVSPEDQEVVFEELRSDDDLLPRYKGKVIGRVEIME